ncbi:MAG: penicillin-binding transpeptidase domain-containing protein [Eubacteriales bacterium]
MMKKRVPRQDPALLTQKRGTALLLSFSLFGAYLLTVILRMQVLQYDYYQQKVIDQITTSSVMGAKRGNVYDSHMNLLASNQTVWRIFISPVDIAEASDDDHVDYGAIIAEGLSEILGLSYDTIYQKTKQKKTIDVTILKEADEAQYKAVLAFLTEGRLSDMVHTEASNTRYYPYGSLAAHVLGFTGSDNQGLYGLELFYDDILAGTDGYYLYAKDATGNEMPSEYITYVEAEDGNSLLTTIDSYIQGRLEYQINEILRTFGVRNQVTGIVMDVNTGAILAMATTSAFDCNEPYTLTPFYQAKLNASGFTVGTEEYQKLKSELLYTMWANKPVSEPYEPGSTFKIITVAAGLDTGAVTLQNQYDCTGSYKIGGYRISCHKTQGHGHLTLAEGLQHSCNPAMMQVGAAVGPERFYDYISAFGYLEKTGVDLPSEGKSIFHKPDKIGVTELATASFGQRFKITPLQHITAIAAVANGGRLVTPYVVQQILDPEGNVVFTHETDFKRQVISPETARTVSTILEQGVSGGAGAKNAFVPGYTVAAKTGTSEKFDILDANGNSFLRVGSCTGYAPANDARVAVLLVVDEPTTAKYGSIVAAPYISALLTDILPYLGLQAAATGEDTTAVVGEYVGESLAHAKSALRAAGLSYEVIGNGDIVTAQTPGAGAILDKTVGRVILYTDHAPAEYVSVPNLLGKKAAAANQLLINCGLNIQITGALNYTLGEGACVFAQSIEAGAVVKRGTVITLTLLHTDEPE